MEGQVMRRGEEYVERRVTDREVQDRQNRQTEEEMDGQRERERMEFQGGAAWRLSETSTPV